MQLPGCDVENKDGHKHCETWRCAKLICWLCQAYYFSIFSLSLTFIFFSNICFRTSSNTTILLLLLKCSRRSPHQSEDTLFAYAAILVFLKLHLSVCAGLSDFRFLRCGFCGIHFSFLVCLIVQKTLCQVVHLQVSMAYAAKGWHLFFV